MTTIATPVPPKAAAGRRFYFFMALATLAVALVGFLPTYFMPLATGQSVGPGILHVHGALFFGWCLYFCFQTWLVANGRSAAHREWGLFGVALAAMMVLIVLVTMGVTINLRTAHGNRDAALTFSWVQASGMSFFGACVWAAVAQVRKPEIHKRLMLLGAVSLLDAPIARWTGPILGMMAGEAGPPPPGFVPPFPGVIIAGLLADLLIVVAMTYDWRTRGRPHEIYIWGGAALLLMQLTRPLIGATGLWHSVAAWVASAGA